MKLKKGFITHTVEGTQMMVAAGPAAKLFRGMVRSNESAAFVVDCLKENVTEDDIVKRLLDVYEVSEEIARRDVQMIIQKLDSIGAIER